MILGGDFRQRSGQFVQYFWENWKVSWYNVFNLLIIRLFFGYVPLMWYMAFALTVWVWDLYEFCLLEEFFQTCVRKSEGWGIGKLKGNSRFWGFEICVRILCMRFWVLVCWSAVGNTECWIRCKIDLELEAFLGDQEFVFVWLTRSAYIYEQGTFQLAIFHINLGKQFIFWLLSLVS